LSNDIFDEEFNFIDNDDIMEDDGADKISVPE